MQPFANALRENIDQLVDRYDAGLRGLPGYDHLPETLRRDLEHHILDLIAQSADTADYAALVQYVRQRAVQWEAMGFPLPWFQQALVIPEEILTPLFDSVKTSNLLWQALNRSQGIVWQMVADRAHQTEQTMRESEERLSSVFDNMQDVFYRADLEGRFVWISPSGIKLLGAETADEVIGHKVAEEFYAFPEARQRFLEQLRLHGRVTDHEVVLRRRDGSLVTVSTNSAFYHDKSGAVAGVEGIFRDITQRKHIEQRLNESEERYRRLSDATVEGIVIHDKGILSDANEVFAKMFGYELSEVIGMAATEFLTPETREITAQNIRSGYEKPYDVMGLRKDGSTFPVEITGKAIPYEGRTVRVTALRDITERQRSREQIERNLQETHVRLEASQALAGQKTEDEVLATLVQQTGIYPQALVTLATFDKTGDDVVAVARYAESFESGMIPNLPMGTRFPFSQFPLFKLLSADRPFISQDTFADDRMDVTSLEITREIGAAGFAVFPLTTNNEWLGYMMVFTTATHFFDEGKQHLYQTVAEQGAVALHTARLRDQIQTSLERRGRQVQLSTEVAQEIAAAHDLAELLQRVVTLIKERFNYYHAQLFRYEPAQDAVVLITGYGATGQKMLAARHKLSLGHGVVGAAAETGQSILATDVRQDADWQPNPYLPDTKGELAVPIKFRDQVLGILDVQSDRAGALTAEDQLLLEGLCGQIAIAMEHRQTEDRLADERNFIRTLIDALPDLIYAKDRDSRFIMANRATAQRMGAASPQDLIGKSDLEFYPADLAQQYLASEQPIIREGRSFADIEDRAVDAEGQPRWHLSTKVPLRNRQGEIIGLIGSTRDITERKREEEILRRDEAQLSDALKIAQLANWEYDVTSDTFTFNDQFYALMRTTAAREGGYTMSSAQYAQRFVHPEDAPIVGHEVQLAIETTDPNFSRQIDHRIFYADGELGYITVRFRIEKDAQGHTVKTFGANQDITERKRIEEALRETEERFRVIAETSPVPILISRIADGTVLYGNDHLGETFGISIPALIGRQTPDFYFEAADRLPLLAQLKRDGTLHNYELHVKRADGTPFWVLVSMRLMTFDNQPALLAAFYDITERKQIEEVLRRNEAQLSEALKIAKLGYWEYDVEKDLFSFNDQFYSIFHTTAEQAGGYQLSSAQYTQQFVHPDDRSIVGVEIAKSLNSTDRHSNRQLEHRIRYADGGEGYISVSINIDRDEQGHILRVYGANQDITERRLAEETLRQSREQLAEAMKVAKLGSWEFDPATETFRFSDQYYDVLHTTAELEGGHVMPADEYASRFIPPEEWGVVGIERRREIDNEVGTSRSDTTEMEHRILYKDGGIGYLWVRTTLLKDENGQVLRARGIVYDITERKLAEQALNEERTRLRTLIDNLPVSVFIKDRNSRFLINNTVHLQILGARTQEEVLGKWDFDFFTPDLAEQYYADEQELLRLGQALYNREEFVIDQRTGEKRWALSTKVPLRDAQDRVTGFVGFTQDITERKQSELRLQELLATVQRSERLMRTLIDALPDHIYAKDPAGRLILVNLAEARLHGVDTPEMLVGKSDYDFYPRELAEQYRASELPILRDGVPLVNHEEPNMDATGQARWSSTTKVPLRDNEGRITGLVGITRNVTDRKQIEETLRRNEARLSEALRVAHLGYWETDLQKHVFSLDDHFYAIVHTNAAEMGGYEIPEEEYIRRFVHPEDAGRLGQEIQRVLMSDRSSAQIEHRVLYADGGTGYALVMINAQRDELGNPIRISGTMQDITERKLAEVERERLLVEQQKRAVQLQTAAEVSRAASSILNTDELLPQAAELIRTRFDLYYVGIFLLDETERWAILRTGTGEAGQRMLANAHKLAIGGNSMISHCIVTRQARIALDVGDEAVRFDNPLLPQTRSEMALPLISHGHVIGAMTIQSDQPLAFSEDDATVLQSMADQIGNAVENARLYEQAQAALQEVDAINRRLTGEAWDTYLHQQAGREVIWLADDEAAAPASLLQVDEPLTTGEITLEPDPENATEAIVTAPILLRGQPIGALRMRTPLNEWDEDAQALLTDIAGHVAQAVENARLVEQTQRTAQRERTINEINARVRQSVDLDAILRTAVNELGQSLKAARVVARVGAAAGEGTAPAGNGRGKTND